MFRIAAVIIASMLLLSNFNYKPVIDWFKNWMKKKPKVIVNNKQTVEFLDVVSSWHTLKNQCVELDLEEAVQKLDEVFPLLNSEE